MILRRSFRGAPSPKPRCDVVVTDDRLAEGLTPHRTGAASVSRCFKHGSREAVRPGDRRATLSRGDLAVHAVFGLRPGLAGAAACDAAARAARPFWPRPILCAIARRASEYFSDTIG
jgi:hypothetical protein